MIFAAAVALAAPGLVCLGAGFDADGEGLWRIGFALTLAGCALGLWWFGATA